MTTFDYVNPTTLEAAGELLSRSDLVTNVLAGGTNLILALENGSLQTDMVVDIKTLPDLKNIYFNAHNGLMLGAAATLNQMNAHTDIRRHFPLLFETCSEIGSCQVRSRATVGGNICSASSSSDLIPTLLCYDAVCHIWNPGGIREVPLDRFFKGNQQTVLSKGEILVRISLPAPVADAAGVYNKLQRGQGEYVTLLGTAVLARNIDDSEINWRIALAAAAPTPIRIYAAEQVLQGSIPDKAMIDHAVECVKQTLKPISDLRASAAYRAAMAGILARRSIESVASQLLGGVH